MTRPLLVMWAEPELIIIIFVFAMAICAPMSMAPKYDVAAVIWIVCAVPLAQLLARIDPRFMRKWRAHRQWKEPGSATLPFVVDERHPIERAARWFDGTSVFLQELFGGRSGLRRGNR